MDPHSAKSCQRDINADTVQQLLRFCIVGVSNVAVSFMVFYFSYHYLNFSAAAAALARILHAGWHIDPQFNAAAAYVVGYVAGMANSFLLNRTWTFRAGSGSLRQAHRFVIINLVGLAVSTGVMHGLVDLQHWPYLPVWFGSIILVMAINFVGNKYWAFAPRKEP